MLIKIHNVDTGEVIEREMNEEELAAYEYAKAQALEENEKIKQLAATKSALLEKLGITEEEAKLLLS